MVLELATARTGHAALAEMMLHLNKHDATRQLQVRQTVPILNGSINRGHYRFFRDGTSILGFAAWAHASREAAHRWAFEKDGSGIGDGRVGTGIILNLLVCNNVEVVQFARDAALDLFAGYSFLCARRNYVGGRSRPVWINLGT
jgi:hypothetical protein